MITDCEFPQSNVLLELSFKIQWLRRVGWGSNTGNIRYGDNWRTQRRLTHAVLHKKASEDLWPVMIKQSRLALQRLLDHPENFTEEFRRYAPPARTLCLAFMTVLAAECQDRHFCPPFMAMK
jgi:hypothetical protein